MDSAHFFDLAEIERLKALEEYHVLDLPLENELNSITKLVKYICKTPVAFISFVGKEDVWIKSPMRLPAQELKRGDSVCNETIKNDYVFEISNLKEDERFANIPMVEGDSHLRFYAGAPLKNNEGHKIGALCVIDFKPNQLDDDQKEAMAVLASEVMAHLEVRKKNSRLTKMLEEAKSFRELFDNSSELHCITDRAGRIEYVNSSVLSLLGYSPEEVIGKVVWNFSTEGEREKIMPNIYSAIAEGETRFHMESTVITKDGKLKLFEWSDVIVNDRWLINGRDVTERKKTERKLQDLSLAVKKSPAGIVIRNSENVVQWMNEAAENIIGYTLEELEGKSFGDKLVGEKTDQTTLAYAKQCLSEKKTYEIEIVLYKKDQTPVWLFISNNPLFNESGEMESQIGIVVDITTRKAAEEQLIKTRHEAIELSKSKEVFLSVMSHEMRTPLNAVIGMSRMLKEEDPLERQKENLSILDFSAQNLLALINDVLDFTKVETGNLQLETVPVDLPTLARKTIESLRHKSLAQKIDLECIIDPNIPALLTGDPTRLYQILINLLSNAVKFTEKGSVKLILELINDDPAASTVLFKISDTGIGIPRNKQEAIFDAYTQADSDTSRKYGGTGLGLAITKKLIELHGSAISVESTPGVGSEFSFIIRFSKLLPGVSYEAEAYRFGEPINASVLVADDNVMNRILAGKILSKWGIKTDFAEDGRQAVEKVRNIDYDLVLMDIHMPVMTGLQAVKEIRSLGQLKYSSLPVVALTASASRENENEFLEAGMNDFVIKPFEQETLYRKILDNLRSRHSDS